MSAKEFQILDQTLITAHRIELPLFDGIDPLGWLIRVEQFFELNGTRSKHKIHLAIICMDGNTVHWLHWLRQRIPTLIWDQFSMELLNHFGSDDDDLSSIGDLDSVDIAASVSDSPMGMVANTPVIEMVDNGASHCFVSEKLVTTCSCKLRYSFVFTESSTLPPYRVTDHGIPLQAGVGPISIKHYSYGHYQKDEIE
ncbi:hypothetical protein GH714_024881 [Hevea brasiliensis]|uniref:Retrotransposon gag domain-containing protein n=1 Tax=Hevea brasiliensis TaxID=3981 RepID=A0A6A6NJ32_HEVBR|nr:hypothetical protein GH714_024881 [Hevea brasiliensis]